ncbi:MAG: hypothetical protein K2X82_08420 [Gemmataceae bacterium]|nr:hypothetical protein [Gemmataceae bacterium]
MALTPAEENELVAHARFMAPAGCVRSRQILAMHAELVGLRDDPLFDCTDAAHPAWWRGHDYTAAAFCREVTGILDGRDDGRGVANDPWETVRRRLLAMHAELVGLRAGLAEMTAFRDNAVADLGEWMERAGRAERDRAARVCEATDPETTD